MSNATAAGDWRAYLPLSDEALLAQCSMDRFRASGPGGQKRNKTESAVRLRHAPTGLTGEAVEERSQHLNRARALRRLRRAMALGLRAPVDVDTYAPEGALAASIRPNGRIEIGRRDARYPEVVAAVFDVLEAAGWRLSDAAPLLGVSTAQIGRFLEQEEWVLRAASERRSALGMSPLRPGR